MTELGPRGEGDLAPPAAHLHPRIVPWSHAFAWYEEAMRLFAQGHYGEAREAFQRIAAEEPQAKKYRVYVYYAGGLEHRAAGRIDDAIKELERAVFLEPELAEARRDLEKTRELKKSGGGLFAKLFGR